MFTKIYLNCRNMLSFLYFSIPILSIMPDQVFEPVQQMFHSKVTNLHIHWHCIFSLTLMDGEGIDNNSCPWMSEKPANCSLIQFSLSQALSNLVDHSVNSKFLKLALRAECFFHTDFPIVNEVVKTFPQGILLIWYWWLRASPHCKNTHNMAGWQSCMTWKAKLH